MADAMCGPSNAVKTLQNHVNTDRSLQHDRMRGRVNPQGAPMGFRTNEAGPSLDSHISSWAQPGSSVPMHPAMDMMRPMQARESPMMAPGMPFQAAARPSAAAGLPDWASEFSRSAVGRSAPMAPASSSRAQVAPANPAFARSTLSPFASGLMQQPMHDYSQTSMFGGMQTPQPFHTQQGQPQQWAEKNAWDVEAFEDEFKKLDQMTEQFGQLSNNEAPLVVQDRKEAGLSEHSSDLLGLEESEQVSKLRQRIAEANNALSTTQGKMVDHVFELLTFESALGESIDQLVTKPYQRHQDDSREMAYYYASQLAYQSYQDLRTDNQHLQDLIDDLAQLGASTELNLSKATPVADLDFKLFTADKVGVKRFFSYREDLERIDYLTRVDESEVDINARNQEDEQLAQIAGQVVESLNESTSEKMKNSEFFKFMMEVNTHTKVVRGDDFVDNRPNGSVGGAEQHEATQ